MDILDESNFDRNMYLAVSVNGNERTTPFSLKYGGYGEKGRYSYLLAKLFRLLGVEIVGTALGMGIAMITF